MAPCISVIICTHNPKFDYLMRVLQALKNQTLSANLWELLLVDNASELVLSSKVDLNWHLQARHIREEQLGLTPARLRGINEAVAETLVFVDDDNVLDSDFLEIALRISKEWQILGAWGGQIRPEFEQQPPDWTKPYWPLLAIREFERDKWSNLENQTETLPCGAGLCVRKVVAEKYAQLLHNQPEREGMDRKGKSLISGGDWDLAFTSYDMGLGTGQFTSLKMAHLIPNFRLQEHYLLRLMEGVIYSKTILDFFRGKLPDKTSWRKKLLQYFTRWRMNPIERRFYDAARKGEMLAIQEISQKSHLVFNN
jgi:glycosyltransferase involved in cell wall biosynthesis